MILQLEVRVKQEVQLRQLLVGDLQHAASVVHESRLMLECWRAQYFSVRRHLEESECDRRYVEYIKP